MTVCVLQLFSLTQSSEELRRDRDRVRLALERTEAAMIGYRERAHQWEHSRGAGSDSEEVICRHHRRRASADQSAGAGGPGDSAPHLIGCRPAAEGGVYPAVLQEQPSWLLSLRSDLSDSLAAVERRPIPSVLESETQRLDRSLREEELRLSLSQS
ncbi:hypothetical protein F7725_002666 [Dissostichus mawsoni]|uniref:Uncharacterized protein n=1 Tax=Dissostichus mawsoni TaxID=36200 RepID=A0A7J5Y589_DISMA|nr:hypothetical protein F7725_002666 [Dissostichus mawsoni]